MLEQIRIASPCSADWERMAGNDRVRFCSQCNLNVFNFSEMTTAEVERLVATTQGRLCGCAKTSGDEFIPDSDRKCFPRN